VGDDTFTYQIKRYIYLYMLNGSMQLLNSFY